MSRASFTVDVKNILFEILPNHVDLSGGKVDWEIVAATLNTRTGKNIEPLSIKNWFTYMKDKHKAWNELKKWTGIGWTGNGCPDVDVASEKWQAFQKKYRSIAKGFLKNPLENEAEWDKILRSGYATSERSYTPASIKKIHKEVDTEKQKEVVTVDAEESVDSDEVLGVGTLTTGFDTCVVQIDPKKRKSTDSKSQLSKKGSKSSREEDINACLNQIKKSTVSQSSRPYCAFDEAQNKLESMGIVDKYGDEFAVDILDTFRKTPDAIELFNSLRSDNSRFHFLRKHCVLDVYRPIMSMDEDNCFSD
ncbi:S-adenosylmethionine synthase [Bienertia sinuspersici]